MPKKKEGIFIPKSKTVKPGMNVAVLLNKRQVSGDVGIEIEVEGKKLPKHESVQPPWAYMEDHSLRGEDNAEYVLTAPIAFSEVSAALDALWAVFKAKKSKFDDSNRTSVHVHLNCQEFHLNRLTSFMAMYFALEEPLTAWCGDHREGNLFCLRAVDAPAIITAVKRFIQEDGKYKIHDSFHYAGLNPQALFKYGSLEIRTLRGCSDKETIETWVRILERLYNLSADFTDPREVCTMLSGNGPLAFFEIILGDMAPVVRQGINYSDEDIRQAMMRGIRLAQDICYCRDWSLYKPVPLKPDPFSRNMKKIAKKIVASDAELVAAMDELHDNGGYETLATASSSPPAPNPYYINEPEENYEEEEDYPPEPEYDEDVEIDDEQEINY
jgi:hypothetical protein